MGGRRGGGWDGWRLRLHGVSGLGPWNRVLGIVAEGPGLARLRVPAPRNGCASRVRAASPVMPTQVGTHALGGVRDYGPWHGAHGPMLRGPLPGCAGAGRSRCKGFCRCAR